MVGFYEVGLEDLETGDETLPKLGLEMMEGNRVLIKGKKLCFKCIFFFV